MKEIVKVGNELKSIHMPKLHKHNQADQVTGTCAYCLEDAVFRIIIINKVNQLACTRCLKSARYYKNVALDMNRMLLCRPLNIEEKVQRLVNRIYNYFCGTYISYPFDIKKKSKYGIKITKLLIKFKGRK